jgi:predicted PurR-regulated permease PerM
VRSAGILAGIVMIDRGQSAIALVAGAATAAILLHPALEAMSRHVPRAVAFVVITLGFIVGLSALLALVTWDLDQRASALSSALTDAIGRLPAGSAGARLAANLDLSERLRSAR